MYSGSGCKMAAVQGCEAYTVDGSEGSDEVQQIALKSEPHTTAAPPNTNRRLVRTNRETGPTVVRQSCTVTSAYAT